MGCWDIFCFLCGNTCHSAKDINKTFSEDLEFYEEGKVNKFFKTNFKPIYETYIKNSKLFDKKLKLLEKNTKWLNNCTFLCANNKIIHGCKEVGCNIVFEDKKGNTYTNSTFYDFDGMYGVFVHTDCWKFIKKEYGVNLSYSHLPINVHDVTKNKIFDFINYFSIEKYWEQDFNFIKMIFDNNEQLSESPLKNAIVSKNIKKIFNKLKIRKDENRISPPVSATFYKQNTYKVGLNGNIWQVKVNKWIECKNTIHIKLLNPNKNLLKKIVFIGDYNNEPLFVLDIVHNKKNTEYNFLSTEEFLEKKNIVI